MNQLCFLSVGYCKTSELRPKIHKHDRNKTISHLENKSTIETERGGGERRRRLRGPVS